MKKRLLFLMALILVAALSLTGCSDSSSSKPETKSSAPSGSAGSKYPSKPITDIVSWSAGGTADVSQRLIASVLPKYLNTSLVIENQAGGAAVPGTTAIANAAPDGYTIGVNWGASFTLRPRVMQVPYKMENFEYLLGFAVQRNILCVSADSPFKTLDELINHIKENPGKLTYSGGAAASYQHMIAAVFLNKVGGKANFIPYDGSRSAAVALMGKHVNFVVVEPASALAEIQAGQLRALCAFENERLWQLPDVPTAKELGRDIVFPHTMMIVAPAGIPADVLSTLKEGLTKAVKDEDFIKLAKNAGLEIEFKTGEQVKAEIEQVKALLPDNLADLMGS